MRRIKHCTIRRGLLSAIAVISLTTVAACGGSSGSSQGSGGASTLGGSASGPTVTMWAGTNVPYEVAIKKGFFKGINAKFRLISKGDESQLFLGSDSAQLGQMAAPDVALFRTQGHDITTISTAGALKLINGVAIQKSDAAKYKSILDLKGKKLAIPGFGSSTYFAFSILMERAHHINPKDAFDLVVADPGAELGLLHTGAVDAALLFSGETAAAIGSPDLKLIQSITGDFEKQTGYPLPTDGLVAKQPWADNHPKVVKALIQGMDRAVKWMESHTEAFTKDGEFGDLAASKGWTSSPAANQSTRHLIATGDYYITSKVDTQGFRDAVYQFIKDGKQILLNGHQVPPESEIFYTLPHSMQG